MLVLPPAMQYWTPDITKPPRGDENRIVAIWTLIKGGAGYRGSITKLWGSDGYAVGANPLRVTWASL
jgi:hypothetical protein